MLLSAVETKKDMMKKVSNTAKLSVGIIPFISPITGFETSIAHRSQSIKPFKGIRRYLSADEKHHDSVLTRTVDNNNSTLNWDDRIDLQSRWTNYEKGWRVGVEWKQTPYGTGLFATEDILEGTLLRTGRIGRNLIRFQSVEDIETFCKQSMSCSSHVEIMEARLNYVKDYLWGFNPNADHHGYDILDGNTKRLSLQHEDERFFGMWVPGNGLNHDPEPNTVYRAAIPGGTDVGIDLWALTYISRDDELFDDYRRHGTAPSWLLDFAGERGITLNFAECNDFVLGDQEDS